MKKILFILILPLLLTGCFKNSSNSAISVGKVQTDRVTITSAIFAEPGFVVIHEKNSDGTPGKVKGLSILYPKGTSTNLLIAVQTLEKNKDYLAVIHIDNHDLKFIASQDKPAEAKPGSLLQASFKL